jgi:CRP/FNR family transcriptional regulator, cyclic AMP receptor protein
VTAATVDGRRPLAAHAYAAHVNARPLVLALTDGEPERRLEVGEILYEEGATDHSTMAVLIDGRLRIGVEGNRMPDVTQPGSFVGEVGALLAIPRTATVVAVEVSTVRIIGDPHTFLTSHPELSLELARQLAGRLHRLTSYLGDLRAQYADAGGHLEMVDAILGRLATRAPIEIEGGSDRSPDY